MRGCKPSDQRLLSASIGGTTNPQIYALFAIRGTLRSMARYGLSTALPISRDLLWETLIINVIGALIISFFGTLTLVSGQFSILSIKAAVMRGEMPENLFDSDMAERRPVAAAVLADTHAQSHDAARSTSGCHVGHSGEAPAIR